jgi:NitT/TauT family transport system substrate-binding protein
MKRSILYIAFCGVILLGGCRQSEEKPGNHAELASATLQLGWIPSGSFAGEVSGMDLFAEQNGLDLSIVPGGLGMNTVVFVQTGEADFGTLAADEVLAANGQGADLVIVGVLNYYSPGGFVALRGSGIKTPQDFVGHTVGLLPFGSTTMLYESMLTANNVDRSTIGELAVSPDLRPFLEGSYDIHPVFVYDETVTLDQQGIEYNLIEPKDFGVRFMGPVYFTRRQTVEETPELVRAFVRTMAEGWNYALQNTEEAIRHLKAFAPEIDEARELQVLSKGADYFREYRGQPVNADSESFDAMANQMIRLGSLDATQDVSDVLQLQFVNEFYANREAADK